MSAGPQRFRVPVGRFMSSWPLPMALILIPAGVGLCRASLRTVPRPAGDAASIIRLGQPCERKTDEPALRPELFSSQRLSWIPPGQCRTGTRTAGVSLPPGEFATRGFYLGQTEVTVGEFVEYLNSTRSANGSSPAIRYRKGRLEARQREDPMTHVSMDDAEAFCRWLSAETGWTVRLPTELEWEFAARGGLRGAPYPWGWASPVGRAVMRERHVRPVGQGRPNGFGLCDMAGNVAEWCLPAAPAGEAGGIARGGSWADRDDEFVTVYRRVILPRGYRDADVGFRIVVDPREAR
jgi:formylglycine-generating enzyme required for sulfatase activity